MIKVCVVVNTFWPEIGAASLRLTRWTDALHESGCKVLVVTSKPIYPDPKLYRLPPAESRSYPILRFGYWLYLGQNGWYRLISMLSLFFSAFRALPQVIQFSPDVVIGQSPPPTMATLAWLFSVVTKAKLLLNVSDLWPQAISVLLEKKHLGAIEWWMNFLYARSQYITTQSEEIAFYLRHHQPVVFRAGAANSFFQIRPHPPNQAIEVIYVGTIGLAHGLARLVKEFWLQDLSLTIVGEGFEKKEISLLLKRSPKKVRLVGAMPTEQIPAIMATADVVLVCQRKPLFGTVPAKLFEAMAAGKPVWLHGGGGEAAELVHSIGCGWVSNESDFEEVVENILASSHQDRLEMGQRGREYAIKKLQADAIAQDFANFVINIANNAKSNGSRHHL